VCDPDDKYTSEDLDITKSDFLKILKAEKIIKYGFAYFVNKINAQIKRLDKILKEKDKIDELKRKEEDMIEKLRLKLNE